MTNKLEHHKLPTPLGSAYVVEDFIDASTESYLLQKIEQLGGVEIESSETSNARVFKSKATPSGWREVKGRRLMEWGGSLAGKTLIVNSKSLPSFMTDAFPFVLKMVQDATGLFDAQRPLNHVGFLALRLNLWMMLGQVLVNECVC
jgi:hypothetical protein